MPRPRRSPPTALRLVTTGVPMNGFRRHAPPSVPQPAFHPELPALNSTQPPGPIPRVRSRHNSVDGPQRHHHQQSANISFISLPSQQHLPLPGVSLDCEAFARPYPYALASNNSTVSLVSNASTTSLHDTLPRQRSSSNASSGEGSPRLIRGPWDHSGCISLPFNVEDMLKAPEPVAISPH